MVRNWMMVSLAVGVLVLSGCGQRVLVQPQADMSTYNRIAILPFETDSFLSTIGHQLADEILVHLTEKVPELDLVERSRVDSLIQEQNLARSGHLSTDSAIAAGRLLGVRGIVAGSVTVSVGDIRPSALNTQRVATGVATIRFIDTETGKVLWAKRKNSEYAIYTTLAGGEAPVNIRTDHEIILRVIQDLSRQLAEPFYPHYEMR